MKLGFTLPNAGYGGDPDVFVQFAVDAEAAEGLEDLREIRAWLDRERDGSTPFDIVVERGSDGLSTAEGRAEAARWEEAGATWWLEDVWQEMYRAPLDTEPLRRRVLRGPPR